MLHQVAGLQKHPAVARVHHPSVATHRHFGLAARDYPAGTDSVFSFGLVDPEGVEQLLCSLKLLALAANIDDARPLIVRPADMTHCRHYAAYQAAAGISAGARRLSAGLEDTADLVVDLLAGLDALTINSPAAASASRNHHRQNRSPRPSQTSLAGSSRSNLPAGRLRRGPLPKETELFALSVSFGGVESLGCYSAEMTYAFMGGTPLVVPRNLVRLPVGIEQLEDLVADLEFGLVAARRVLSAPAEAG